MLKHAVRVSQCSYYHSPKQIRFQLENCFMVMAMAEINRQIVAFFNDFFIDYYFNKTIQQNKIVSF